MTNNRKTLRIILVDSFEKAKKEVDTLKFEKEPMGIFVKELHDVTSISIARGTERWRTNCYAGNNVFSLYEAIGHIAEQASKTACSDGKYSAGIRSLLLEFSDNLRKKVFERLEADSASES